MKAEKSMTVTRHPSRESGTQSMPNANAAVMHREMARVAGILDTDRCPKCHDRPDEARFSS
jgi:hypothetical protein